MSQSCCNCGTTLGEGTKIQPTTVTPADGQGASETWCPKCFVAKRMHEEPKRFNAAQSAAIVCRRCGWESVSFGAKPHRSMRCNPCSAFAGKKVPLPELPITPRDGKDFVEVARAAGAQVAVSR